jgi:hypothetical protein
VVWVVQAGRGMVRGHDQPCGSTPAQPAVGPHPAPAAATHRRAPAAASPRHVPDRNCVAALLFMARTSTPWNLLPARSWAAAARPPAGAAWTSGPAQGCSSSSRRCCWTNWARPAASTWSGSWSTPPASARSKGALTGANPVDRGKQGTKLHLAGDAGGLPLAVVLTAANAHDSTMLGAVVDDIPPIRMPTRRRRPPAGHRPRRQGLRLPTLPRGAATPWDHPPHRPAPRGVLAAAWPPPLADRADDRLAAWLAAAAGPLRAL